MAATTKEKVVKALGFENPNPRGDDDTPSISNADPFIEPEPTVREFIEELTPSLRDVGHYIYNLFPFIHWIGKYNLTWFIGDLIAGKLPPVFNLRIVADLFPYRSHGWRCRRSPEHGLRTASQSRAPVWFILFLHGCINLLVLCHLKGYYHWRKLQSLSPNGRR
jgi:hypothetical protein